MKKLRLPVIFLLLTVLLIGAFLIIIIKKAADRKTSAEAAKAAVVTDVGGKVTVEKTSDTKIYAFIGMMLVQSDRLETGASSFAALELGKGKELIVSENTRITISELTEMNGKEETWLKMETGAIWANLKEKLNPDSGFEIETPTAVMGVRGTKFSVLHHDDTSTVTVIEGRVEAAVNIESTEPDGTKTVKKIARMVEPLQQLKISASVTSEEALIVEPLTAEKLDPFTRDIIKDLMETQAGSIGEEIREQLDAIIREASVTATPTPEAPAYIMTPAPTATPESTMTHESTTPEPTMTPESTIAPESTTSGSAITPVPTIIPPLTSTGTSDTSPVLPDETDSTEGPSEASGNETDNTDGNGEIPENNVGDQMEFDIEAIIEWDLNADQGAPEGFTEDVVPVIPDGRVIHSEIVENQFAIIVRSMKSFDETYRFYHEYLEDANWFVDAKFANYYDIYVEKEGYGVQITGCRDKDDPELNIAIIVAIKLT